MNAVEIEAAVSDLALHPFDAEEFPFDFLQAFANKGVRYVPSAECSDRPTILADDEGRYKLAYERSTFRSGVLANRTTATTAHHASSEKYPTHPCRMIGTRKARNAM